MSSILKILNELLNYSFYNISSKKLVQLQKFLVILRSVRYTTNMALMALKVAVAEATLMIYFRCSLVEVVVEEVEEEVHERERILHIV